MQSTLSYPHQFDVTIVADIPRAVDGKLPELNFKCGENRGRGASRLIGGKN